MQLPPQPSKKAVRLRACRTSRQRCEHLPRGTISRTDNKGHSVQDPTDRAYREQAYPDNDDGEHDDDDQCEEWERYGSFV